MIRNTKHYTNRLGLRGAEAVIPDLPAKSAGPEATALDFRAIARNDFLNVRMQFPTYEALYSHCQMRPEEAAKLEHAVR